MRALLAIVVMLALAGCDRAVVRVGAPPDASAQLASALLAEAMGSKRQALHRETCASERACLAALRSGDLDIVVVDGASIGEKTEALAATGLRRRPRVVVSARGAADLRTFAIAVEEARVAVDSATARRAMGGYAALARLYRWARAQPEIIEAPLDRLAAVDDGRVDAAVVDESLIVGDVTVLDDPANALGTSGLSFVINGESKLDRVAFREAAATAAKRAAEVAPRALVAIASGVEPRAAVRAVSSDPLRLAVAMTPSANERVGANAVLRSLAARGVTVVRAESPATTLAAGGVDLALAGTGNLHEGIEAVAVFDRSDATAATLWQRIEEAPLSVADAERVLAASAVAREPAERSMWARASEHSRTHRVAAVDSEVLDSILNVLVCLFAVWLVVSIFRRENMPRLEDGDEQATDRD